MIQRLKSLFDFLRAKRWKRSLKSWHRLGLAIVLCLSLLLLSKFNHWHWDWSYNRLNSASPELSFWLTKVEHPLRIRLYSPDVEGLNAAELHLKNLFRQNPKITLHLHAEPLPLEWAKRTSNGLNHIVFEYRDQAYPFLLEKIDNATLVQWLTRIIHRGSSWIVFLEGHGERSISDANPKGLRQFSNQLKNLGYPVAPLNLRRHPQIPKNTQLLIVTDPKTPLLSSEKRLLQDYVNQGRNLWWLSEPEDREQEDFLTQFGVELIPGTLLNHAGVKTGSPHPAVLLVHPTSKHPILKGIDMPLIFPWAHAIRFSTHPDWKAEPVLKAPRQSVIQTGPSPDSSAIASAPPSLTLGMALHSLKHEKQQILICGDSDFIANETHHNAGNRALGLNIIRWFEGIPTFVPFKERAALDLITVMNPFSQFLIQYGFRWILPFLILLIPLWKLRSSTHIHE